jgi:DNA-binding NtrC family response regulator
MARVREAVALLSGHPGPFLVRGEPGTGKSLVAELLGSAPSLVIDCRRTKVRRAQSLLHSFSNLDQTVLRLEEVGDAARELQVVLVDFIRVRGTSIRLVATTSRDIDRFARIGKLLPEFVRMMDGPAIWLPPLRTRRCDIVALTDHFLESLPGREIDGEALSSLERQAWPGNVRQLREAIRRLALLHDRITASHVERELREMRADSVLASESSTSKIDRTTERLRP